MTQEEAVQKLIDLGFPNAGDLLGDISENAWKEIVNEVAGHPDPLKGLQAMAVIVEYGQSLIGP